MPASTSDPISSMLQRTFGGLDHKREGLIRGGNSSSATPRPFSVDKKLQASAKHGLIANNMEGSSINFDSPTSYKSDTSGLGPKVIVLNPNQSSQKSNVVAKKEQKDDTQQSFCPSHIQAGRIQAVVLLHGISSIRRRCCDQL